MLQPAMTIDQADNPVKVCRLPFREAWVPHRRWRFVRAPSSAQLFRLNRRCLYIIQS